MDKPICPNCGKSIYVEKYEKDGCYVCAYKPNGEDGGICGKVIGCKCMTCKRLLQEDRFGLRNDVFECKTCGRPQWGYTEYKKDRKAFEEDFANLMRNMKISQDIMKRKMKEYTK